LVKSENDSSGYLHIKAGSEFVGGIPAAKDQNPQAPPHWLLYFLTRDCKASAKKAADMGARTFMPATLIEHVGTVAVMQDAQGAVFALFQGQP
jgi:predicted enzyme related to lactoylglutathione lyase